MAGTKEPVQCTGDILVCVPPTTCHPLFRCLTLADMNSNGDVTTVTGFEKRTKME